MKALPDGILAGEIFSREAGIDDGGHGRTLVVAGIEETAALQRNAHSLRIGVSHEIEQRERHFVLVGGFRLSFDPKGNFGVAGHGQRAAHQGNALDTGNILKSAQCLAGFHAKLAGSDVRGRGERHVIREHLARIESGIYTPHNRRARPPMPSLTPSVSSWRITRAGLAPSAERMANSRARPVERARSKLATLAHAMSNTKPTAPSSTSKTARTSPTTSVFSGTKVMPVPLLESG